MLGTFLSDIVLALLSYVAENERKNIKQRQKEGISAARLRGVQFGRPAKPLPENFSEALQKWESGELTGKEAAKILGISIATLDAARNNGLIAYVQYVQNGCVYFTDAGLQEYIAKCTHRAKPVEKGTTYRKPRSARA